MSRDRTAILFRRYHYLSASRSASGQRAGHSLSRELEILAIHGYLHLLGFEHGAGLEEEDEKVRCGS